MLKTRQMLIEELIDSVKDRIHLFVESEIYAMFLKDNLKVTLERFHEFEEVIVELTNMTTSNMERLLKHPYTKLDTGQIKLN